MGCVIVLVKTPDSSKGGSMDSRFSSFQISPDIPMSNHIKLVVDLMTANVNCWNVLLIQSLFSSNLCKSILSTLISQGEPDKLIWVPTSSGEFTVRSTYPLKNSARFSVSSRLDKQVWKSLWISCLHERHKIFIWKILNNVLPTKDRIRTFLPVTDPCYYVTLVWNQFSI